jgi:predicted RNase H-like nuclease (RuvC/YqgF family)
MQNIEEHSEGILGPLALQNDQFLREIDNLETEIRDFHNMMDSIQMEGCQNEFIRVEISRRKHQISELEGSIAQNLEYINYVNSHNSDNESDYDNDDDESSTC